MGLSLLSAVLVLLLGLSAAQRPSVQPVEEGVEAEERSPVDITSRILEANKGISQTLMEGDVFVSNKRNAMRCWSGNDCRWSKSSGGTVEVPYSIDDYFNAYERSTVNRAMQSFHSRTCIRFVPRRDQEDYLSIENLSGCWSPMGKQGGRQPLSLSVNGCIFKGIVQHELLHALGFFHEHTRSDRDQYVDINWDYIPDENARNFYKQRTNNLNTPYDYSSIMHYGRTAFTSTYGRDTITPKPDSSVEVGQRIGMSDIDILRINTMYECTDFPRASPGDVEEEGRFPSVISSLFDQ